MIEYRSLSATEFKVATPAVVEGFAETVAVTPPFAPLEIHQESMRDRLINEAQRPGFRSLIAQQGERIVGATWYQTYDFRSLLNVETLPQIEEVVTHLQRDPASSYTNTVVFVEWTYVLPEYQNNRIGSTLREETLAYLAQSHPGGAFVLGWYNLDNPRILRSCERLGFKPTGIQPRNEETSTEYWYRTIDINYLFDEAKLLSTSEAMMPYSRGG